jgi:hypothetical protein
MLRIRPISAAALAGLLALAAIPARGRADQGPRNVIVVGGPDGTAAQNAVVRLEQAVRDDLIWMESYVIVARDARGRLEVTEDWQRKPSGPPPPNLGPNVAGLVATLGFMAGFLTASDTAAELGYVSGAAFAPRVKPSPWSDAPPRGPEVFEDQVSRLEHAVPPGQTALIAVIEERVPTDGVNVDLDKARARQQLERELPALKTAR